MSSRTGRSGVPADEAVPDWRWPFGDAGLARDAGKSEIIGGLPTLEPCPSNRRSTH